VNNNIEGSVLTSYVKDSTTELKDYCNKTLNGLRANIPKDEVRPFSRSTTVYDGPLITSLSRSKGASG
jgi:hypothetical protein